MENFVSLTKFDSHISIDFIHTMNFQLLTLVRFNSELNNRNRNYRFIWQSYLGCKRNEKKKRKQFIHWNLFGNGFFRSFFY